MSHKDFGIDLGTKHIKISRSHEGILYDANNVIAVNEFGNVIAYGEEAYDMYEKTPESIVISFPISKGVIANVTDMTRYLQWIFESVFSPKIGKKNFYIAVPTNITDVEKRAFISLLDDAPIKTKNISIVEKPMADACGLGIDALNDKGNLIVDIGAATTEITIISMGGIVYSRLLKVGGDNYDINIAAMVKNRLNTIIGLKTASSIKYSICDLTNECRDSVNIMGRNIVSGLPSEVTLPAEYVYDSVKDLADEIVTAIKNTIERTPPEIFKDISERGIFLTGGSSRLKGIDRLVADSTGMKVNLNPKPEDTVIKGLERIMEDSKLKRLAFSNIKSEYE